MISSWKLFSPWHSRWAGISISSLFHSYAIQTRVSSKFECRFTWTLDQHSDCTSAVNQLVLPSQPWIGISSVSLCITALQNIQAGEFLFLISSRRTLIFLGYCHLNTNRILRNIAKRLIRSQRFAPALFILTIPRAADRKDTCLRLSARRFATLGEKSSRLFLCQPSSNWHSGDSNADFLRKTLANNHQ